ncbi:cache domain-containing protein [Chromohalobacter nigrandesensis]|uniref:cache domain-containing protein n=1 Tax=Chromohalobacter nigrandesensis TaxID=119863 RepID=UPI001FF49CCC|nr:cache domain-containing protein [Chromohalobacter nigrandesensis]MCK0745962.1 cache domain-containing protein [Chromohalobacter nigrandesensis]
MTRNDFFYSGVEDRNDKVRACAKNIEESVYVIVNTAEKVRDDIIRLWGLAERQRQQVLKKDLAELQGTVKRLLSETNVQINGAGFVVAPNVLADTRLHLEWWRDGVKPGHVIPLRVNLDEGGDTFYDYPNMPWFYKPRCEGVGHVIGPYVDMMGVDMYICTFSLPIVYDGQFLGIAGADVPLNNLEAVVTPHLVEQNQPLILVNDDLRVIASNSSRYLVGEFFKPFSHSSSQSYYYITLGHSVESWRLVCLNHYIS